MENNGNFSYTYSAQERKEVEAIRGKYLPGQESKLEQLRRLHAIPTRKAQSAALSLGILGALIMGTGMSLAMTDIGIALGSLAMVLVALAYPVYNRVLKTQRAQIAPEVLRLSEELLK